eukprot:1158580-Pelagomonas_calceolata.AAC.7
MHKHEMRRGDMRKHTTCDMETYTSMETCKHGDIHKQGMQHGDMHKHVACDEGTCTCIWHVTWRRVYHTWCTHSTVLVDFSCAQWEENRGDMVARHCEQQEDEYALLLDGPWPTDAAPHDLPDKISAPAFSMQC